MKSSETALTDSTVPNSSSALYDVPDLGQLEVDDLAQLLLRVVGDADRADLSVDPDPLVAAGVVQVFGIHAGTSFVLL